MKLTEGQKWIYNRLKDFGFNPDAAGGTEVYYKALRKHLGLKRREEFLDRIDAIIESRYEIEQRVTELVGSDLRLLKLVVDVYISIYVLDCIMDLLDDMNLDPLHIVDFGGANGWSLLLIKEFLETNVKLSLIEQNKTWDIVSDEIQALWQPYDEVDLKEPADVGVTIFGAPADKLKGLFECAQRNIQEGGYFIAALRIGHDEKLQDCLKLAARCGFELDKENSCNIKVDHPKYPWEGQRFPILVLKKGLVGEIDTKLILTDLRMHKAK